MNLLAHALLSGTRRGMIAGGTLADWIKGPLDDALPAEPREGIRLHRAIDTFTDAHPLPTRSRERLKERWGRYSGIIVDVAYDHFLASGWDRFGSGPLPEFVEGVHTALKTWAPRLPAPAPEVVERLIAQEWLIEMQSREGLEATLRRISRRMRRPVPLAEASGDIRSQEAGLASDFAGFFPQVRRFAEAAPFSAP